MFYETYETFNLLLLVYYKNCASFWSALPMLFWRLIVICRSSIIICMSFWDSGRHRGKMYKTGRFVLILLIFQDWCECFSRLWHSGWSWGRRSDQTFGVTTITFCTVGCTRHSLNIKMVLGTETCNKTALFINDFSLNRLGVQGDSNCKIFLLEFVLVQLKSYCHVFALYHIISSWVCTIPY